MFASKFLCFVLCTVEHVCMSQVGVGKKFLFSPDAEEALRLLSPHQTSNQPVHSLPTSPLLLNIKTATGIIYVCAFVPLQYRWDILFGFSTNQPQIYIPLIAPRKEGNRWWMSALRLRRVPLAAVTGLVRLELSWFLLKPPGGFHVRNVWIIWVSSLLCLCSRVPKHSYLK